MKKKLSFILLLAFCPLMTTANAQDEEARPHVAVIEESIGIIGDVDMNLQSATDKESADALAVELEKLHNALVPNLAQTKKLGVPSDAEKARLKNTLFKDRLGEVKTMLTDIYTYIDDLKKQDYYHSAKMKAVCEKLLATCKELARVTQEQSI